MLIIICLFTLLFSTIAISKQKKIYVWRNDKGVLVFSDTPQKGAEEIKLNSKSTEMKAVDTSILYEDKPDKTTKYQIEITTPEDQSTLRENSGSVHINGRISPRFSQGHKVQLYFDGVATGSSIPSTLFVLRNIDRGEHNIQLKLIDLKGKVIASSDVRTFYLHRTKAN